MRGKLSIDESKSVVTETPYKKKKQLKSATFKNGVIWFTSFGFCGVGGLIIYLDSSVTLAGQ